jgi:hypothetical protein
MTLPRWEYLSIQRVATAEVRTRLKESSTGPENDAEERYWVHQVAYHITRPGSEDVETIIGAWLLQDELE